MNPPKITITYDNGMGDVVSCSCESDRMHNVDNVSDWFLNTGLQGIGFTPNVSVQ